MARTCIIRDNEIRLHFYEGKKYITFSKEISSYLYKNKLCYLVVKYDMLPHALKMHFSIDKGGMFGDKSSRKITFDKRKKTPIATIKNEKFVNVIARHFILSEGMHYLVVSGDGVQGRIDPSEKKAHDIGCSYTIKGPRPIPQETTKQCPHCGRTLPLEEFYHSDGRVQSWCKDCSRDHGRLRNGTTGEYRDDPTISKATDQQLYDELKRRGYEGTMYITKTLQ